MIERAGLLADLLKLVDRLEKDLRQRWDEVPALAAKLTAEYQAAFDARRTAETLGSWRTELITQVAVAWVLSSVFLRFLEDNTLVTPARLSGPPTPDGSLDGLARARQEYRDYIQAYPEKSDREYLQGIFDDLEKLPGTRDLYGPRNLARAHRDWLSGDAAREIIGFFQKLDERDPTKLQHDFADPAWDTRFLGDLYQDLSEEIRKRYALLQTPDFVESFILDYTLEPAIETFGLAGLKIIDPACGSGHFLLGSFSRLLERWRVAAPGLSDRELAQRAMSSIHGVDLNPYATAIAKFRLLTAYLKVTGIKTLAESPDLQLNLACGDSLLHGQRGEEDSGASGLQNVMGFHELAHVYQSEDREALQRILTAGQYHAVVANPPYITPKDKALNQAYRERFGSVCHMKYALSVPFMARLFELALPGGYVGQITSNSFMKREFGKKLIEEFFGRVDLTHVIDTSGAYIPGHGTPTVILFGRQQRPVLTQVQAVLGIKGEPSTPADPAKGLVWSEIVAEVRGEATVGKFVSRAAMDRSKFLHHPWSIGGGGAAELKELIEEHAEVTLESFADSIGFASFTGNDDVFAVGEGTLLRLHTPRAMIKDFVIGEIVRDWTLEISQKALVPYDSSLTLVPPGNDKWGKLVWRCRETLRNVKDFGGPRRLDIMDPWYGWYRWIPEKYKTPLSITFGEVATHNHFVLDRGGKVFKQTAPVIKLPKDASEEDHLALLGLLNSSTACFWMKQVAHQKQMMGGDGVRITEKSKVPYAFNSTMLGQLPIPSDYEKAFYQKKLLDISGRMSELCEHLKMLDPHVALKPPLGNVSDIQKLFSDNQRQKHVIRSEMIYLQEELDFTVYAMFGLCDRDLLGPESIPHLPLLDAGDRPFCMMLGYNVDGFSTPQEIRSDWPEILKILWKNRIDAIAGSANLRLVEDAHYKRRWIGVQGLFNLKRADNAVADVCHDWLLTRLESYFDFDGRMNDAGKITALFEPKLVTSMELSDAAGRDPEFIQVAELYRGRADFDRLILVEELLLEESVPALPVLRFKPSGLDKHQAWKRTWELQRQEDTIDARTQLPPSDPQYLTEEQAKNLKRSQVGTIPVPPKYEAKDFLNADYSRLRGKLDVPKERWVSFPHCLEPGSHSKVLVAWAGLNHLELAKAIWGRYELVRQRDGTVLEMLLASLAELIPWLKQYHNEFNEEFNLRMGDYFEATLQEDAAKIGKTLEDLAVWTPPAKVKATKGPKTGRRSKTPSEPEAQPNT